MQWNMFNQSRAVIETGKLKISYDGIDVDKK